MTPRGNQMEYEILEDGTIKLTTGKISGQLHMNADQLVKYVELQMGGSVKREKLSSTHLHAHTHEHEHA